MRLSELLRIVIALDSTAASLYLQILVISALIFLSSSSFYLFGFSSIYLISSHLRLIVEFFFSFSGLSSCLFFHLTLEKTSEHIFLVIHFMHSLFLISGNPLLKFFNLFFLEITSMLLLFSLADGCFVTVDAVKGVLIFHKLAIILFID